MMLDARKQDAAEFVRINENLLSSIKENPEIMVQADLKMKQWEEEVTNELLASKVGQDFMKKVYTL